MAPIARGLGLDRAAHAQAQAIAQARDRIVESSMSDVYDAIVLPDDLVQ